MATNKVVQRTYIQITGTLGSPLLAGSGLDEQTKMDVTRNHLGKPFMTGSALAGALRQQMLRFYSDNKEQIESLFGVDIFQSRLYVSDIELDTEDIGIRDGVKLEDENKVAAKTGKFDMEIVERDTPYMIRLEYITREASENSYVADEQIIKQIIAALANGHITIGGKSNRGFGKLNVSSVKRKQFHYSEKAAITEWLNWSWEAIGGEPEWTDYQSVKKCAICYFELPLQVAQTLLIRNYRTEADVDYGYLKNNNNPVIPGATWAGAFRHRLMQIFKTEFPDFATDRIIEELFGTKHSKNRQGKASRLIFEESVVKNASDVKITRNAIDRFSGATIQGALFTGEQVVKGETSLVIRWHKVDDEMKLCDKAILGMLQWVSNDLASGLLAVGGETAVGRGVFEAEQQTNKKACQAAVDAIIKRGTVK